LALQRENGAPEELPASLPAAELTNREREVLWLLASGSTTRTTARDLCISCSTVKNHVQSILAKLGVHTRLEAVSLALRSGMLLDKGKPSSTLRPGSPEPAGASRESNRPDRLGQTH
jgi:two-component system nitrate/nitrite response regulator NarL